MATQAALRRALCVTAAVVMAYAGAVVAQVGPPAPPTDGVIQVFLVPHSHDDTGWQRTVDQYHHEEVKWVYTSVIEELQKDPKRKFTFVEIAFFQRWWDEQTNTTKQAVRDLITAGQLECVNGGWCMADGANPSDYALTKQITTGHQFILNELGVKPRVGYHIDPFGHSAWIAPLFADLGYDAFIGNRIDSDLKNEWKGIEHLEFVWRPCPSRADGSSDMFTHILDSHYSAPSGYDWEYFSGLGGDDVAGATKAPTTTTVAASYFDKPNVAMRAELLLANIYIRASWYPHNLLYVPEGDDFKWQQARIQFANMDPIIDYINANTHIYNVTIKYATVSEYIDAVHALNKTWPVYANDFMVYNTGGNSLWSGYYTSRPQEKGFTRASEGALHAAEAAAAVGAAAGRYDPSGDTSVYPQGRLTVARRATSVAQHHDAITGTSRPPVVADFTNRVNVSAQLSANVTADAVATLLRPAAAAGAATAAAAPGPTLVADASSVARTLAAGSTAAVVVYNALGWTHDEVITVPGLPWSAGLAVADAAGAAVTAQVTAMHSGAYELAFVAAGIPPLGFQTYFVSRAKAAAGSHGNPGTAVASVTVRYAPDAQPDAAPVSISGGGLTVSFDATTHLMSQIAGIQGAQGAMDVTQDMLLYKSGAGCSPYVLAPVWNSSSPVNARGAVYAPLAVTTGPVFQEAVQWFTANVSQRVRLYSGLTHGAPVPYLSLDANVTSPFAGHDLACRLSTPLRTGDATDGLAVFRTDSNGAEMMRRHVNETSWHMQNASWPDTVYNDVAQNYYPSPTALNIRDSTSDVSATLLSDRARGATSLQPGALEVMLHRRCAEDASISLNDTTQVDIRQRLLLGNASQVALAHRTSVPRMFSPSVALFGDAGADGRAAWVSKWRTNVSFLAAALPPNVHLMSFETGIGGAMPTPRGRVTGRGDDARSMLRRDGGTASGGSSASTVSAVLRLQHVFGKGEHPTLSGPVTVDLATLFDPSEFVLTAAVETTLSANQEKSKLNRLQWNAATAAPDAGRTGADKVALGSTLIGPGEAASVPVTLTTLMVRTFSLELTPAGGE